MKCLSSSLENGKAHGVVQAVGHSIGVDTQEGYERVRTLLEGRD